MIKAECHSDDFVQTASFDATRFFEQAAQQEIEDLARCGWRGDYPADHVAEFSCDLSGNEDLRRVFDYLGTRPRMISGDTVGFECIVDEDQALCWLKDNRPHWLPAIAEAMGEEEADLIARVEAVQAKAQASDGPLCL